MPLPADLDKGGGYAQKMRSYFGPSLGWLDEYILPQGTITSAGTFSVDPGTSLVLVDVAGLVTLNLGDVNLFLQLTSVQPANGIERCVWIKDYGGNAAAFNITINPFGTQKIDKLTQLIIGQNRQIVRLYPIRDASGWFVG